MKTQISVLINRATLLFMILLASILMPFNIYAAGETQIVPTYTSSITQQEWQTKLRINNYCEGTTASTASCKLSFYVTGSYYGVINIDGYDSSGTHWINGGYIFVSDGYGEYNYNFYQNGIKQISSISIWGVQLFQPDSNVDLTQIIQLLTSVNNYESSSNIHLDNIEDNTANTITEIQNVLSQLIVSNGYLETLTKLRQWNIPIESYPVIEKLLSENKEVINVNTINYYNYPVFSFISGETILNYYLNNSDASTLLFLVYIKSGYQNTAFASTDQYSVSSQNLGGAINNGFILMRYVFTNITGGGVSINFKANIDIPELIPIYVYRGNWDTDIHNVSTDFALQNGLNNRMLRDLNIIANGTASSNQQSQDLSSGTDSMQDQMENLVGVEDSYNQQFNNSVNSIDFNNPLQQNQGLLGASNFVITVFNGLIANNPFSILIIIVCILLIGKKVIGK